MVSPEVTVKGPVVFRILMIRTIYHLCYGLLCVFPEIALQKLNEQKDIFTLGDWLVPALIGKMDVKSIWRKIQDHGWWQNDRNL